MLVPILLALTETGCPSSCNCPHSSFVSFRFPAELDVQLAATGGACPYTPSCDQHGDGGGCTYYEVTLARTGDCHVTATAADGRQESADLTAVVEWVSDCCGTSYGVDSPPSLTFDQDASLDTN